MILFLKEHVAPILAGKKIETRRMGKKRWRIGSVHQARTQMLKAESCFARLKILSVRQEPLHWMRETDAAREGYDSLLHYRIAWERINGRGSWDENAIVWVVGFRVVKPMREVLR